jgi:hypothetical protein
MQWRAAQFGGGSARSRQGLEVVEDVGEPVLDDVHGEERLAVGGVGEEIIAEDIGDDFRIAEFAELAVELTGEGGLGPDGFAGAIERLPGEDGGVGFGADDGGDRLQAGDAERFALAPFEEADSMEALEDEAGGAVAPLDCGADESGAGEPVKVVIGLVPGASRGGFEGGDAEQPVPGQGFAQHGAVAGFEDIQGQEGVRKEVALREHDGRNERWQLHHEGDHDTSITPKIGSRTPRNEGEPGAFN